MALFWLSDEGWAAVEPHLPKNQPGAGTRMAQALALCEQLPTGLGMTHEQVDIAFHHIADDDRAQFLLLAY